MPPNISLAIRMISPSFPPRKLFFILYQLTKSKATSFNSFQDILITSFRCPNLQREITRKMQRAISRKNKITFVFIVYQVIYSLSPISCSSLFKAPSCKSICDFKLSKFKFAKSNKLIFFLNFHQVIYSFPLSAD